MLKMSAGNYKAVLKKISTVNAQIFDAIFQDSLLCGVEPYIQYQQGN